MLTPDLITISSRRGPHAHTKYNNAHVAAGQADPSSSQLSITSVLTRDVVNLEQQITWCHAAAEEDAARPP